MKTFTIGQRSSYQIKNANIEGFFVTVHGIGSAVNTTPVLVDDQLKMTAKLSQGAFNDTIIDGLVRDLWKGPMDEKDYAADEQYMHTRVVTAAAAEVVGVSEWSYLIKLPTVINLNGDDFLEVEIDFPSGSLTDHAATSYVMVNHKDGIGSQFFIPRIKEYTLPALETSYEQYLGDNIIKAVFCGDTDHTPSDDGLTQVEIYSDRRNEILAAEQLTWLAARSNAECAEIISYEHDQVKIRCTMDGTLNAAGDLRLVVTSYYTDASLVAEGQARQNRHLNYAKRKISS